MNDEVCYHDNNDNYYYSEDEISDWLCDLDDEDLEEVESFLYVATLVEFKIDADWTIESALDDHHDDAYSLIKDESRKELQELLDAWCKKQNIKSWEPTTKEKFDISYLIKEAKEERLKKEK